MMVSTTLGVDTDSTVTPSCVLAEVVSSAPSVLDMADASDAEAAFTVATTLTLAAVTVREMSAGVTLSRDARFALYDASSKSATVPETLVL